MGKLTIHGTGRFTTDVAKGVLRRAVDDLRAVQKEQIASAFRNHGQPAKKWPPLWADKFVGKVRDKDAGALLNAQSAFFRATSAKKLNVYRIAKAQAKVQRTMESATNSFSYRRGGEPLADTGQLRASFFTKYAFVFEAEKAAIVVIASSAFYAQWHQDGFSTRGPNFIPLTMKAKRQHVRGANPSHEGLEYGVDYVMAWNGVKVPARVMIDYEDPANKKEIEDTISLHLK